MAETGCSAEARVELADGERAAMLYELLIPHAERTAVIGLAAVSLGAVARYLDRLALVLERREEAIAHLRRAIEVNRRLRAAAQRGHAQVDLATALGPGAEAAQLLRQAGAVAQDHGLSLLARRARVADRELS